MRKSVLLLVTLLIVLALTGCAIDTPEETGPISITDSTGHTEEFESLPERIVIAGRATVMVQDAVFLFPDALEKVVAVENRKQSLFVFLPLIDPEVESKAVLEMNAGAEQIAALDPDLVIMKNFMAEQIGAPLGELDIPVLYLDLETPDAFYTDLGVLGQVFGAEERATELVDFYQSRVETVENATMNVAAESKPDVLLLSYNDKGEEIAFEVPPAGWLQTTLVELAGGTPVWTEASEAGGWAIVGFEQIAAWDADQIFVIDYKGRGSEIVSGLYNDPLWMELTAVQNNELYAFAFDYYSWDQPDTRWILGLEWLATKIQPEVFSGISITDEAEAFYTELYGVDSGIFEEQVVPLFTGDIP